MKRTAIETILVKFLANEANHNELELLERWLKDEQNLPVFNHFVRTQYVTSLGMAEYDIDKAKDAIRHRLQKQRSRGNRTIYKWTAVAASIVLIIGVSIFKLNIFEATNDTIPEVVNTIEMGSSKAVLTLENGSEIALWNGEKYQTEKAASTGE